VEGQLGANQWRNVHGVGLVQKLRVPDSKRGPHQSRPIAQKIKKRKKMQVKNQWESEKLIMLNNKASIDNGS
jgi:hypothetical protein